MLYAGGKRKIEREGTGMERGRDYQLMLRRSTKDDAEVGRMFLWKDASDRDVG